MGYQAQNDRKSRSRNHENKAMTGKVCQTRALYYIIVRGELK